MNSVRLNHSVGKELRRVRASRPQQEFADVLGVGKNTIARYESGERKPDVAFLRKLYDLFGIEPNQIVLGRSAVQFMLYGGDVGLSITPDEAALLHNFRRASKDDQRAIARLTECAANFADNKDAPETANESETAHVLSLTNLQQESADIALSLEERRDQIRARLASEGKTLMTWARENNFNVTRVYRVMGGLERCLYGKSYEIAVKLGLKEDPKKSVGGDEE